MRKLIESTLISLDGVIESPNRWAWFDEEATAQAMERLDHYDAFVMGRVTYETLFTTWAEVEGNPYTDRINAMPMWCSPVVVGAGQRLFEGLDTSSLDLRLIDERRLNNGSVMLAFAVR